MKRFNLKLSIILLLMSSSCELGGIGYITLWREHFWAAVEGHQLHQFLVLIGLFSATAVALGIIGGFSTYMMYKIALDWRRRLTKNALKQLDRLKDTEGHEQRIQEDCKKYPMLFMMLAKSFLFNGVLVVFYILVIIIKTNAWYLIIPFGYIAISTLVAGKIAHPLLHLNYYNQVVEAAFRQGLTGKRYAKVHSSQARLINRTKWLNYFQGFTSQIGVIFPYLVLAPAYFAFKMTFGVMMQVAATISYLTDSLSVVVNSFDQINDFLSCRKRLIELQLL